MSKLKSDSVYYNWEIRNDSTSLPLNSFPLIQARQDINFDIPLLENPSDFYCSITRFSVSGKSLPLMVIPILGGITQTDPNLTPWVVSLVYNNTVFSQPVIYQDNNDLPTPKAPSQNNGVQDVGPYYYIQNYEELGFFVNQAIELAYTALKTAFPLAPIGQAPYFRYIPTSGTFRLIADRLMAVNITPLLSGVSLFFNSSLGLVMDNFGRHTYYTSPVLGNPNLTVRIGMFAEPNNSNEYFVNGLATTPRTLFYEQEYPNTAYINAVKSIVFISNSLGTGKEYISARNNTSALSGLSILTDFQADFSENGSVQDYINYSTTGTGNYRLVDIKNTQPIYKLDLSVYWTDINGNLYPIFLPPSTYINVKFVFTRKSIYKGNN